MSGDLETRPRLTRSTAVEGFKRFYWLKRELVSFCREVGISSSGDKREIQARVEHYLATGEELRHRATPRPRSSAPRGALSLEQLIPSDYRNDARHRAFFSAEIGPRFKFNVVFMRWMREHTGHTYREAVDAWLRIESERRSGKKPEIGPQFEYNQYIRDFFESNPGRTREDAIRCWRAKRSQPGHNRYEPEDLSALG